VILSSFLVWGVSAAPATQVSEERRSCSRKGSAVTVVQYSVCLGISI